MASDVPPSSAPASPSGALENELASLIRVRNRLAQSSDSSLPRILTGLLPRLLVRLEHTYDEQPPAESSCPIRAQIRSHLVGILVHALERIIGNTEMSIAWLPSILASLESESHLVRTLTLSFVQAAMPRCTRESAPVEALLRSLDRRHVHFIHEEITESGQNELRTTSWLLLDAIAIVSGLKPMIDWDLDCYNEEGRLGIYEPPEDALSTPPLIDSSVIQAVSEDGAGLWDLLLDVLLFWPGTAMPGPRRRVETNGGMSQEGRGRMMFRLKERSWNDMMQGYLRHLKAACFSFAVAKEHPCVFQGVEGSIGSTRALMLAVLLASENSMVGKAAGCYLQVHIAQMQVARKPESGCSLSMACSMLVLVLGDEASIPVLDQYSQQRDLLIGILGPRPSEVTAMRAPLPLGISAKAIEFIGSHLFLSEPHSAEEKEAMRLFVDLAVTVQKNHIEDGLWAIRLIYGLYKQMQVLDKNDWTDDFRYKCLSCAKDTLSGLPDPRVGAPARLEEEGEARNQMAVQREARRRAEDELFVKHRLALRKQRLRYVDAVKARENAYEMISSLGSWVDKGSHTSNGQNLISFDLAVVLLKCALLEDEMTKPRAIQALGKLLKAYTSILVEERNQQTCRFRSARSIQHQAALLIPSLVDAACCESESVRLVAAQWTVQLLFLVDRPAAYCLGCFLADDANPRVVETVKSLVENSDLQHLSRSPASQHAMYEFLDLSTDSGFDNLTMELNLRISSIARALSIPTSAASVLLTSFGGSPNAALDACAADRDGVLQNCGVLARCTLGDHPAGELDENFVCGICYDDETPASDSYALPCGHRFCMACWISFLENKLDEGPTHILNAMCPNHDCTERITGVDVNEIVPHDVLKWKDYYLRQFVGQESHHRFCTGPDCDVVVVSLGESGPVSCHMCETSFCFGCGETPHVPANCEDFDSWKTIFGSSEFWVSKHAKPCPGCDVPIEKTEGCNHMKCSLCKHDFCWICLAPLDMHLMAHTCNRYDPAEHAENDDVKLSLFFTERFQAHEEAELFAMNRLKGIDDKVQYLLDRFWILTQDDAQELVEAEETLVDCRRFLKNSYVAAYGMKDDQPRRQIFESHQGALELLTEKLSGRSEMNLDHFYVEKGERALRMHLRAVSFYTFIVKKYMQRIVALGEEEVDTRK